jgi:hypothetical protein
MPDTPKLSQAEFASKIRQKYNSYQDIDDSTLVSKFIEKYPVYADRVDASTSKQPVETQDTKGKLKEAIQKDRQSNSSYFDIMLPDYVKVGYNAARTVGSLVQGAANGVEAMVTAFGEAASHMLPSAGVGAPSLNGPVEPLNKAQRKEMMSDIRKAGKQAKAAIPEIIKPYSQQEARFDITDGFGVSDLKALPEIAGRVALDIPMGMATGGTTYFVQGYGDAIKEYDEQTEKSGVEPNEKARQFYGVAGGTINGLLEQFAIDKIFKGPAFTKVKSKILADVMKRTAGMEGKLGVDAIQGLVAQETKKAMSTLKNRGIKALYAAGVESGTEGLQTGLQEGAKLVSNEIAGEENFDPEQIKSGFWANVVNSAAAGGIMGGVIGGGRSLMKDTNNEILRKVAETKTPEDVDNFINDLDQVLAEEKMSPEEQEMVKNQVRKYAEIKQTIPNDIAATAQDQAIRLIEARNEVDAHIKSKEEEISKMDEAVAAEEMRGLEMFKDARNSFNDRIRDVVSGEKTKYYEQDGKYFKQIGENAPEAISKNRFEFEQTYDENAPQGPTELETLTQNRDNAINEIEKQRKEELSNLLKSPLTGVEEYNGEFDNQSVAEYAENIRKNNKLNKKAAAALNLWEKTVTDLNNKYDQQIELENNKFNENATTISTGQESSTTSGVSQYKGTEGQQTPPTNETDNSNRPIGSETQEEVNVPTSAIKNKAVLFLQKQLNPFGVLGRTLTSLKEQIPGYISAEMKKGEIYIKNVQKTLAKYKDKVSTADIDAFLTGETPSNPIPEDLAKQLTQVRKHIDDMTQAMIDLKIITDPAEIELFNRGKGSYLTRAYSMFDQKGLNIDNVTSKLANVDQTVLDAALEYIADAIYNQSVQTELFTDTPKMTKEEAMNQAKIMVDKILSDAENPFTKKKLEGSLNVKSLTERQDIAAPIRALMGEYTDPLHKYAITVFKMANLLSSQKYMTELKTIGMGKFLFKEGDPNFPKEATALLAAEGSSSMAPLAGLYTFPELKAALEQAEADKTLWITKAAGTIRAFKTVYNPMTHVKNVFGNLGFLVSNAHWSEASQSFELVKELLTGKNTEKLNNLIFKLNAFGVLNNTVGIGELKAYFDQHNSLDELLDNVYNKQDGRIKRFAKSAWNKVTTAPQVAYQMEDDIFKIIAYVNESNRYAKALYSKDYTSLNSEQQLDIDKKVSEIVKNTYPTFSRVPQGVKNLSKVFFLGNFLAFPVESVRVSYESLKLAYDELNSGNPVLKNIGAQRIAGTIAYNSALSGIVYYGAMLAGTGLSGMAGYLFDEDKEKKKANAYRMYMAPWNKDKDAYVYQFKNGKLVYVDMGGSDPYGYQKEVWNTFWDNLGDGKGFWTSMATSLGKAAQPFTEMDMTVKAVLNLAYNEDDYGRKIYKESDSKGKASLKTLEYLNKTISPGVITTATRMYDAYNEDKGKFSAEVASLSGYRVYTVDLLKQFGIMLNAKNKSVVNPKQAFKDRIESDYTKSWNAVKNSNVPEAEKDIEYQRLSDGIRDILKEMREYYDAAIDGGVKESDLIDVLNRSGIKPSHRLSVMEKKFDYPNSYYLRR